MKPTRYTRGKAQYLGDSKFKWIWPCGHTKTEVFMIGPKGPNSVKLRKPMHPGMCKKMAQVWEGYEHINLPPCQTCKRKAKAK